MQKDVRKLIFVFLFLFTEQFSQGQSRKDTIKFVSTISKRYLDLLFNERRIDSVAAYWTKETYDDLAAVYNKGKIHYIDNKELLTFFSKDFYSYFRDIKRPIKFSQTEIPILIEDDDGFKHVLIRLSIKGNIKIDSTLGPIFLDFVSKDHGKTWLVNDDHWIKQFMYFRYRK